MRGLKGWLVVLLLVIGTLPGLGVRAQGTGADAAVNNAVAAMRTQQEADGTFKGFGAGSTADAIYALVAAKQDPATFKNGNASALDGLRKLAPDAAKDPGLAAKFVLALHAAGQTPKVGDIDLVAALENSYNAQTAQYGKDVTGHAFALLALQAMGKPAQPGALDALKKLQLPDGGWGFDGTALTGSDTNTTALTIQALIATEGKSDAVIKAVAYLKTQQNDDGGFPYSQTSQFGNASDANSTAYVVQGLLAAGENIATYSKNGKTPLDRLRAFQNASGAFRFQDTPPDDNAGATYQVVPALIGVTFPLARATTTSATPPTTLPNSGTNPFVIWPLLVVGVVLVVGGLRLRRRAG